MPGEDSQPPQGHTRRDEQVVMDLFAAFGEVLGAADAETVRRIGDALAEGTARSRPDPTNDGESSA